MNLNRFVFQANIRAALLAAVIFVTLPLSFAASGETFILRGHSAWIGSIVLSSDEKKALSASEGDGIRYWDLTARKELAHFEAHHVGNIYATRGVQFSSDDLFAVSGGHDKAVAIWNLKTLNLERRLLEHKWAVNIVSISPRGDTILSAGLGPELILWNWATGKPICKLAGHEAPYALTSITFTDGGKKAISTSQDRSIRTWDLLTCKQLSVIKNKAYKGGQVAIATNSGFAVSLDVDRKTLLVWNINTGDEIIRMTGHTRDVNALYISADGKRVISGGEDKRLLVWDVGAGTVLKEKLMPTEITSLAIFRTGTMALVGGKDNNIYQVPLE